MKRIKDGNFSPLPLKNQQDEIGVLLETFNAMATELANARQKLKEEAQSRRHVQAALQEADKLITIGQLSAGLAHEIGSPLQILKGRAEHLLLCAGQPEEVIRHCRNTGFPNRTHYPYCSTTAGVYPAASAAFHPH